MAVARPQGPIPVLVLISLMAVVIPVEAQASGPQTRQSDEPLARAQDSSHAASDEDDVYSSLEDFSELSLEQLMNIEVVTASRRAQPIASVPYAISVISAEDIRRSGARSIPDALRLVPGVDVADLSFGNAAVSPRGLHGFLANQTLVLVDGRQIFDSIFGGTLWGSWPFQLEDIDRIEVIRGPGGVTWGANAVNGVINIITKDPADQLGLSSISTGGSRGTFKQHAGYALQDGNLRLRISGEYEASDGFRRGGSFLRGLEDDYKAGRTGVYAVFDRGPDDTVTLSAGNALVDGGFPPPPSGLLGGRRNSGSQASFILGNWSHKNSPDNHFDLTAFANDFQMSNGVPAIDYRYQQFALQFSHTFKPAQTHTLTWGIDSRVDLADTTNADPFMLRRDTISSAVIGTYLNDEWRFAPKWSLSLGARIDYESYGGFEPSGRVSLSHELSDDSVVYGAVSRSFGMPPAAARFLDTPLAGGLVRVTADRDIRPSALYAYELGYRGRFFDRLSASLNLYWHEYKDQATVSPGLGPPGLLRIDYDNRGAASMYGAELDLRFAATRNLTLLGNYTFQDLDWRSPAPWHERDLVSPPKNKFMVGARYSPTDQLHLSTHLYYVDAVTAPNPANPFLPRRIRSYLRLDLFGEYEFWDGQASIAIGVNNLLDSDHYEGGTFFINDAESPRMVFAEFRLRIN
jgi:iron complex outermembrane receptor protein